MRLAAALTCFLTATTALAQEWPSERRGYESASLDGPRLAQRFYRFSDGILIEDVMINGKGPYRFLLDTGAEGAGRLDAKVVEELGLPLVGESQSLGILNEVHEMTEHSVETLAIGGLSFHNVRMLSRDYSEIAGPGYPPIHGILGFHLFNEYLLTIDYPARTISVEKGELPPADGSTILDIISDDEDPEVEVSVGGHMLQALLDTGAMNHFAVPESEAASLRFAEPPVVRGSQGGSEVRVGNLADTLRLGQIEFENIQTYTTAALNQSVVGARVLAELRVSFDQKNGRVRIERPAPRPRFGLNFGWRGPGPWMFSGVTVGSIAEKAGILPTDTIVSINGIPFDKIDRSQLLRAVDEPSIVVVISRDGQNLEIPMSWE